MIPTNKIVLQINGWMIDNYLKDFADRFLPAWDLKVTSAYRSMEDQARLKERGYNPAPDSAHLYNLARDFVIYNRETGLEASESEYKHLWGNFIRPNWIGYTYMSPGDQNKGPHIHANIDRTWTNKTQMIALAGGILTVGLGIKSLIKKFKK